MELLPEGKVDVARELARMHGPDDLARLTWSVRCFRRSIRITHRNILFALGVGATFMTLSRPAGGSVNGHCGRYGCLAPHHPQRSAAAERQVGDTVVTARLGGRVDLAESDHCTVA